MSRIEKSIDVAVPLRTAYNQWTQFEEFPRFMEGVESVRQLGDRRLSWRAKVGGKTVDWTAEIVAQKPDRFVSWKSTSGHPNSGTVSFEPLEPNRTRVSVALDFEPKGFAESAGDALGVVSRRVQGDLERFKEFLESRGTETGAWRGQIPPRADVPRMDDPGIPPPVPPMP
jgi:uncharacterized membrane protein